MTEKIIFDGKVFKNTSEIPQDIRDRYVRITQIFQDDDLDGIPDVIQSKGLKGIKDVFDFAKEISQTSKRNGEFNPDLISTIQITDSTITINGKKFNHIDDMPSEIRDVFERLVYEADPAELNRLKGQRPGDNKFTSNLTHYDRIESEKSDRIDYPTRVSQEIYSTKLLTLLIVAAVISLCGFGIWLVTSGILPQQY